MLGPAQWAWLEQELQRPAELRLIATSIQFVPSAHGGESWANLPHERQRFLDLLVKTKAGGVVFLSGDRHWCEVSRIDGPLGYPLYDITASAMTQTHPRGTPTPNQFRHLSKTYHDANVGRLHIDWTAADPALTFQILDVEGQTQMELPLTLSQLKPR
jgi:alkaline phosphatase D